MSRDGAIEHVTDVLRLAQRSRGSFDEVRRREVPVALRRRAECPAVAETVSGVETLRVPGGGQGTIVLVHGGGFVTGAPELCLPLAVSLARSSGCDVVLPRYRLAPEHPAPAASQDIAAVATRHGDVVLVGCSAGAGVALAAGLALLGHEPALRGLVLISPWVDLRLVAPTLDRAGHIDPGVSLDELQRCARAYRGPLAATDPCVSPVFDDLSGLPPVLIQVGTDEALHGDAVLLAMRLRNAAVSCDLSEWPEMIHNWQFFADLLADAGAAIDEVATWSRNAVDSSMTRRSER